MVKSRGVASELISEAEFTKIQELVYELRIDQIMTHPVVSVAPQAPMVEAKESMRTHRISGLPVTSGERLAGILSVEDIIRWLEAGRPEDRVSDWMTANVHTVRQDQAAVQAVVKFGRHKMGRLPVVDQEDRLVGILTPGDIIGRALMVLDALYREAEARHGTARCTLEGLLSEGTTLTVRYDVAAGDFQRAGGAATRMKRILETLGIDPALVRRAGIAAYEAEMNLAIHSNRGGTLLMEIAPDWLLIEALDDGPGIANVEQALTPGFSTAPDWIRELGFGAGMGLNNIRNCADQFSLQSQPERGTTVQVRIRLKDSRSAQPSRGEDRASAARGVR